MHRGLTIDYMETPILCESSKQLVKNLMSISFSILYTMTVRYAGVFIQQAAVRTVADSFSHFGHELQG